MADRTDRTPQRARTRAREDWAPAFLGALEDTHLVCEAARKAGIGRRTAYDRRQRDQEFAEAWDEVIEHSTEVLEQIAVRRAAEGSDQLLMFLLRARRPEVYSEQYRVRHSGRIEAAPEILDIHDPKVRARTRDLLHAVNDARRRRLSAEGKR